MVGEWTQTSVGGAALGYIVRLGRVHGFSYLLLAFGFGWVGNPLSFVGLLL